MPDLAALRAMLARVGKRSGEAVVNRAHEIGDDIRSLGDKDAWMRATHEMGRLPKTNEEMFERAMMFAPVVGPMENVAAKLGNGALNAGERALLNTLNRSKGLAQASKVLSTAEEIAPRATPLTVSTRMPTAKKALEDPVRERLSVGLESSKLDPQAFGNNMRVVSGYSNMPKRLVGAPPEEIADEYISNAKDNLLWLHDQVPDPVRQRSKLWYDGAHRITKNLSEEHGIQHPAAAGVAAVLSPQKDWFMNADLARRVIETAKYQAETPWSREMTSAANRIFGKPQYEMLRRNIVGKRLADLDDPIERAAWLRAFDEAHNPRPYPVVHPEGDFGDPMLTKKGKPAKVAWGSLKEISKALSILDDPTAENISRQLGGQHKVRSFYNNIIAPNALEGDVTADTHAVAANLLRPLSGKSTEVAHNFGSGGVSNSSVFGTKGTYGVNVEPYREAAKERGVSPREMQSITWEAVRGLFPSTFKSKTNAGEINAIWKQVRAGRLSPDDARKLISDRAGGIRNPAWFEE